MIKELFLDSSGLITSDLWKQKIIRLKDSIICSADYEKGKKDIISALRSAVIERDIPARRIGVLFSGGLDSSLIALILKDAGIDFDCLSVGFMDGNSKTPVDISYAREIAEEYKLSLKERIYDLDEMEEIFLEVSKILHRKDADVVNFSVAAVEIAASKIGKYDILYSGGGSEEIFAGYRRHETAKDLHEECWNGLVNMYNKDIIRDFAVFKSIGTQIAVPFLDPRVIAAAMKISPDNKIREGHKKFVLREAASAIGLKRRFAFRGRKAAQYGTSFDKALNRLAKRKGYYFKKDYIASFY